VAIVCAIRAALLAIYGHDWVHRVFRFLLYRLAPADDVVTLGAIFGHAGGHAPPSPGLHLRRVHGPVLGGRRLQHHLRAVRLGLLALPAARDPARSIIAAVFFGASGSAIWLIALGAWLATRLGADDGLVGLQTAGNNVIAHLGRSGRVPLRRRARGDDGHERLRRHADRADRHRLVKSMKPAGRRAAVVTIVGLPSSGT
jgi:NCS1 family nucleobase:cation symporter-1